MTIPVNSGLVIGMEENASIISHSNISLNKHMRQIRPNSLKEE